MLRPFHAALASAVLALSLAAQAPAAAKQYQVTGKLLAVTDTMLTVEKGDEKWEIDRTADLKTKGTLKVGEKVTVYYHMVADKTEVKEDAKPAKK